MTAPSSLAVAASAEPSNVRRSGRLELAAILLLAVLVRAVFWTQRPPDMGLFLEPWFAHIVHFGPINAFAHPFSNYEPLYLYFLALGSLAHGLFAPIAIIKFLSVAGTLFLVIALAELLKAAGVDRRGALFALVLPSVAINDTLLAQCDALWAGSCILGLAAMIRGQSLRAMVWCGIAVAFKAQAAFMAPLIIGAMIGRRVAWWQWGVPALVFVATLVPPWLLGWPAGKLLTVYFDQAAYDRIPGRLGNPWMLGTMFADHASRNWFALGYAAAAIAAVTIGALAARGARDARLLILLGALAGTALPFLLPKMLERYYFLGDVMTLALALSLNNRPAWSAMRSVQMASILTHLAYVYFFYDPYPALLGALFATAGLIAMCQLAAPDFARLVADVRGKFRERALPTGRQPPRTAAR